jgi:hypothetical protein
MTVMKLVAIAVLLCCAPHFTLAEADHIPPGGPGGDGGGARQWAVPGAASSEKPRAKPEAMPLGTEMPLEELERRKREIEQERLPPTPGQQMDESGK